MLDGLLNQQMNIISLGVLVLFLIYAFYVMDINSKLNKVYLVSLFLNMVLLVIETVLFTILDIEGVPAFFINLLGILLCICSPILSYLFLKLVCLYFPNPYKIKTGIKRIFTFLMIINIPVSLLTFKAKIPDNYTLYSFIFSFVICFVYISYSVYVIFKEKKSLILTEGIFILGISVITNFLILVQYIMNNARFIFVSSTFILIMMFIVIQQKELYRDPLTGARNRLVLKKYLNKFVKLHKKHLSVVMIDLDYFKNINDTYGHAEGDHVLKIFVRMLQKVFSDEGIVIRMGGDEFIILVNNIEDNRLEGIMERLSRLVDKYNHRGVKPYRIKFSYATGVYDDFNVSVDQFIHQIDLQMYNNKKQKKSKQTNRRI